MGHPSISSVIELYYFFPQDLVVLMPDIYGLRVNSIKCAMALNTNMNLKHENNVSKSIIYPIRREW
jgi:hypothetical protein